METRKTSSRSDSQSERRKTKLIGLVVAAGAAMLCASGARADYTYQVLTHFQAPFALPNSTPIVDGNGNFYGTDQQSGSIYQYSPATAILTQQYGSGYGFSTQRGISFSQPTFDDSGNLYGTTFSGSDLPTIPQFGGTLYKIDATTHVATNLVSSFTLDHAAGAIVITHAGDVYGSNYGGSGTIWKYDASTKTASTIYTFPGTGSTAPYGGLIADSAGNLYGGTTTPGGGTVFKFDPISKTLTTLATFSGPVSGTLTLDAQHGYLYGTTSNGGSLAGDGSVFVINLALGTTTGLHEFVGSDGANPFGQLHIDAQGNIFGTTSAGGPDGFGTVYELQADGQTYQYPGQELNLLTLHAFGAVPADGETPMSGLYQDSAGNLYGTTLEGSGGVLYELAATPEPASLSMLAFGALFARRRRQI